MVEEQHTKTKKDLKVGIANRGVLHYFGEETVSLEDWFKEVSSSNVFDYVDKTPAIEDIDNFKRLSKKYNLPVLCSGWFYRLGVDDNLILDNLKLGSELGSKYHNVQIFNEHADGHLITDQEIAETYLKVSEYGEEVGCLPCFEIHINMWSENFLRMNAVKDIVQSHNKIFRMTLDHSHVVFKMNNEQEMEYFDLRNQINSGKLILDPYQEGNISEKWINEGIVWLMHARSVIPNNPKNIKAKHPDGTFGRGVQYPFIKPNEGEYFEKWDGEKLEPWKEIVRKMINYHYSNNSHLECISTEFIPATDYGEGSTYSLFNNAVACAEWIKDEINKVTKGEK